MKSKTVDIYYFSGTGNTFLISKMITDNLLKNRYNVNKFLLEKSKPEDVNLNHTIGLAVPVAYYSTYPFIWKFINNLPKTNGTDLFLISTCASTAGALALQIKKVAIAKGYNPIGAITFKMPLNLTQTQIKDTKLKRLIEKANIKAIQFVESLINDKAKWQYKTVFAYFFFIMLKLIGSLPIKLYRHLYELNVNDSKCTQCGICYQICPADTIRMYEFPRFEDNCEYCMRCFAHCPEQAIYFNNKTFLPFKSANIDDILSKKK